jgi:hypothetical protein
MIMALLRQRAEWHLRTHRDLHLVVHILLEDLQVGPEDVPHKRWGSGNELLLGHGTDLLALHPQTAHKEVNVGALE